MQYRYKAFPSPFGMAAVVWWKAPSVPRVRQVFLCGNKPAAETVRKKYSEAQPATAQEIDHIVRRIRDFLEGKDIVFDLAPVAMEVCGEFQRKILLAEYAIPRGWVSTYGRLARHTGTEGGGRAAGRALAENPFPILIPCHRAIRADGGLGGYQGGTEMKRTLLEMEGMAFASGNRVILDRLYY
jgi:methylated-DNA-[protein]-cysteine S-methyltransferase